ncbi:hypothetical protein BQ8482_111022 [Mesorhizobium delmotii]|uniref:Uncharacterized protein n=1 Tax=Mesorhizobium delmotii TaxID=1631247 RepID=A0A2P9ADC7_9HYPH|nr:hypothetical protein BQ8482_111022 [Mesorhizobium delmotii]
MLRRSGLAPAGSAGPRRADGIAAADAATVGPGGGLPGTTATKLNTIVADSHDEQRVIPKGKGQQNGQAYGKRRI